MDLNRLKSKRLMHMIFNKLHDIKAHFQNNIFLSTGKIGEIDVIIYKSDAFESIISLHGAQLLHWKPTAQSNILFTSPESNFIQGIPIRGGVPICWPWFGKNNLPAHGFARLLNWHIKQCIATEKALDIILVLTHSHQTLKYTPAKFTLELHLTLTQTECDLTLTYQSTAPDLANVTAALHTYFEVSDIAQTQIKNIGTTCFNTLTSQTEIITDPLVFEHTVDCYYPNLGQPITLNDLNNRRVINIQHQASDIVVWNPWEAMPDMTYASSRHMLCVESAYIDHLMQPSQLLRQTITYQAMT